MSEVKKNILDNKLYKKYYPIASKKECEDFVCNNISYIRKTLRKFERYFLEMETQLTEKYTKKLKDPLMSKSAHSAVKKHNKNQQIMLNMKLDTKLQRNISEINSEMEIVMKLQEKLFNNDFSIEDCNVFLKLINDYKHHELHQLLGMIITFIFMAIIFSIFSRA